MSGGLRVAAVAALLAAAAALGYLSSLHLGGSRDPDALPGAAGADPGAAMRASAAAAVQQRERRPDFELANLEGGTSRLSDWQGEARIVNFWATWCAPCRREIPLLKEIQAEHGDAGIQVIGVAVDFPDAVAEYAKEMEFNYPNLVGQEDASAAAATAGIEFLALPFSFMLAPGGELVGAHVGELHPAQAQTVVDVLGRLYREEIDAGEARAALREIP